MCSGTINFVDDLLRPRHLHDVLLEQGHEGLPSERVVLHFDGTCGSVLGLALSRDRFGAPADADASVELLLLVRLCDGGEEHRLRDVGLGLHLDHIHDFRREIHRGFLDLERDLEASEHLLVDVDAAGPRILPVPDLIQLPPRPRAALLLVLILEPRTGVLRDVAPAVALRRPEYIGSADLVTDGSR